MNGDTFVGSAFAFDLDSGDRISAAALGDTAAIQAISQYFVTAPAGMSTLVSNHDSFAGPRLWNQVGGNVAAYELAAASGRNYKPGDQISYYIKATPKKVAAYEAAKLASEFDPQNRDENVDYYISKLGELVKKFGGVTATVSGAKQESLAF